MDNTALLDVTWINPYTNLEEYATAEISYSLILNSLRKYAKENLDVDLDKLSDIDIIKLLSLLKLNMRDILDIEEIQELCRAEFMSSPEYIAFRDELINDFEYMHDLGEYREEDEYVEG